MRVENAEEPQHNPGCDIGGMPRVSSKIRIVLVNDHRLFRDGLRAILAAHGDHELVGEASDAREAEQLIERVAHDLIIVDITLPGSNGLALIRDLKRRHHPARLLVLTMHQHADMVADAFAAGADGYALKHQSEAELVEAVRTAAAGQRYLAPQIPSAILEDRSVTAGKG